MVIKIDSGQLFIEACGAGKSPPAPLLIEYLPVIQGCKMRIELGFFASFLIFEKPQLIEKLFEVLQKKRLCDVQILFSY